MDIQKIGKFIANLRKEKGITQEELAQELYVSRENVSKWERGVNLPTAESLIGLSKYFNVSVNEILMGETKNSKNSKEFDNVSLDLLKTGEKKIKKIMKVLIIELVILVLLFLGYYFLNNYKTVYVYRVIGENENFSISSGLAIFSNQKNYLKLGKIESKQNKEFIKYEVFYYTDKEHKIYESDDDNYTLISVKKQDDYFPSKDRNKIINDTYIRITYADNKTDTIKLEFFEDLSK